MDMDSLEQAHEEVVNAANELAHVAKKLADNPNSAELLRARRQAGARYRTATDRFSRLCGGGRADEEGP